MVSNREIFEIYWKKWNKQHVVDFVKQNHNVNDDVVHSTVDIWMRTFKDHWKTVRSRNRFVERKAAWLDLPFQVCTIYIFFHSSLFMKLDFRTYFRRL